MLLYIAYNLLKGRPENRDQRASQSTATIKLEYKTLNCAKPLSAAAGGAASNQQTNKQTNEVRCKPEEHWLYANIGERRPAIF